MLVQPVCIKSMDTTLLQKCGSFSAWSALNSPHVVVISAGMALFLKNVAFHGILLDALFEEGNREWEEVSQLLKEGIMGGVVRPLKTTVFERDQVEEAFRYMAQGKHIGKVLLQVCTHLIFSLCSQWANL